MINILALSLVLSSLATSCVFTPSRQETQSESQTQTTTTNDDVVIVKEGRRAVVVEYEKEGLTTDGHTKISISPQQQQTHFPNGKPISEGEEEELSSAAAEEKGRRGARGARELVCDAFGKCKYRIASAIGKAEEKVSEVGEGARETLSHATADVSEIAKETAEKAKTMGKDVQRNVSTMIESAKEKTKEKAEKGKEMAEEVAEKARTGGNRIKEGGEKVLKEIIRRGQEVAAAMDWVVGVVHLLGFSTAYGICVWITFVSSYLLAGTLPRQQLGMVQSRIYPVYFRVMAICVGVALVGHLLGRRGKFFTSMAEMLQGFHLLASLLMILINSYYLEPQATKVMFEKMKFEKEEGRGRVDPVSSVLTATPARGVTTTTSVLPATPARGVTTTTTAETISTPPASVLEKQDTNIVESRMIKLDERLKKLNAFSSLLNVFTLVALTWHLVYLGQRLHLSC